MKKKRRVYLRVYTYILPNSTFGLVNAAHELKPINPNEALTSIGEYGLSLFKTRIEEVDEKR